MQFYPTVTAALAEERQADLRREAEQARLARQCRRARKPGQRTVRRWRLFARRPAHAPQARAI
jgi:hypothetical protein